MHSTFGEWTGPRYYASPEYAVVFNIDTAPGLVDLIIKWF